MINMLNTVDPTTVPTPTSLLSLKITPISAANNSGADEPAAMNVAPTTSGEKELFSATCSMATTKWFSHTT